MAVGRPNSTQVFAGAPFGIATYAAGNRAYVANGNDGTISVIDTTGNGSVLATWTVTGAGPNAPNVNAVTAARSMSRRAIPRIST